MWTPCSALFCRSALTADGPRPQGSKPGVVHLLLFQSPRAALDPLPCATWLAALEAWGKDAGFEVRRRGRD